MVKVVEMDGCQIIRSKVGGNLKKQNIIVADATSALPLTAWEAFCDKFENGKSYKLVEVNVYKEADSTSLATTQETQITSVEDIGKVAAHTPMKRHPWITKGNIIQIKVGQYPACGNCGKSLRGVDCSGTTCRCPRCEMKQSTASLKKANLAEMRITDQEGIVHVSSAFDSTMIEYLSSISKTEKLTPDEIEDIFLDQPQLMFTISREENRVVKIENIPT